ncbi:hypothetical protein [Coleofasciculus sp.]|uniref:hypothetical protein n=1 Tax=Coleofasciculus sp. TaxID=3100458 RepID=UPI003A2352F0
MRADQIIAKNPLTAIAHPSISLSQTSTADCKSATTNKPSHQQADSGLAETT